MARFRPLWFLGVSGFVMSVAAAFAQAPASPGFEAATIKQNLSGQTNINFGLPRGGFTVTNAPLREIVRVAYGVSDVLLVGGPDWAKSERYDINARVTGSPDLSTQLSFLRILLADRVKLAVHHEMRELPAYVLMRARDANTLGPKLMPSTVDCDALLAAVRNGAPLPRTDRVVCGSRREGGQLQVGAQTMGEIAALLTPLVGRPVVDRTLLGGRFDVELEFTPDDLAAPQPDSPAPSIFTALHEQLGLTLVSQRAPVDVLVIDHIEHPTEN
jgi:uncharacterized protein (TIGR03435 family)